MTSEPAGDKPNRNRWLLVETFGGPGREPSVIAKGRTAVWMVPLGSLMRRSRYVDEMRALVQRAANGTARLQAASADRQRKLVAVPLEPVSGQVHGVHAWIGRPDEQPPFRDAATAAGAWSLNLTSGRLDSSAQLDQIFGVRPEDRARPLLLAEAFERLLPHADEGRVLTVLVRGRPGDEYQGTWTARRDDGDLAQVTISCRTVTRPGPGGRTEVVTRGIAHDISAEDGPRAPDRLLLERQVLIAEQRPGTHRVIVDPRNLRALRWIDEPPSGLACTGRWPDEPVVHPADLPEARTMAEKVAAGGRSEGTLRLRDGHGGWRWVGVTASQVLLDQDTSVALVALSTQLS